MFHFSANSNKLAVLVGITLIGIVTISLAQDASGLSIISSYLRKPTEPSSVFVGPRKFGPFYHGRGCDSANLLSAIAEARLRPDGASRHISTADLGDTFLYRDFIPSFDLDSCPPLHIFSPAEACDLLGSYGGLVLSGDSLIRHLTNALFIILSGRNDGAMKEDKENCRGEKTFIDQPAHCRLLVNKNSDDVPQLCGGNVFLQYDEIYEHRETAVQTAMWEDLMSLAPPSAKSPVFFQSHGLHFHLVTSRIITPYIQPLIERYRNAFPKPVMFWGSIHYPPANKPAQYREEQGPIPTKKFNDDIGRVLEDSAPGSIIGANVTMKQVDWFSLTNGAESFDGGHYSYQGFFSTTRLFSDIDVVSAPPLPTMVFRSTLGRQLEYHSPVYEQFQSMTLPIAKATMYAERIKSTLVPARTVAEQQLAAAEYERAEYADLATRLNMLAAKGGLAQTTMMELGEGIWVDAVMPDTKRIILDLGFDIHLALPTDEAAIYAEKRSQLLEKRRVLMEQKRAQITWQIEQFEGAIIEARAAIA